MSAGQTGRGRFITSELESAWAAAPPGDRYRYKLNARLIGFLALCPVVVWLYWLYTVLAVPWTWQLTAFTTLYALLTAGLIFVLLRWRAFCLISGVVFEREHLVWSYGQGVFRARWNDIDPTRLGVAEIASQKKLEAFLLVGTVEGKMEQLWLYRPFAYLDGLEGFMAAMLAKLQQRGPAPRPKPPRPIGGPRGRRI
jgi:hypothetical protein